MEYTCHTRQPDLPGSPGEFLCTWQSSPNEALDDRRSQFLRTVLDRCPDEEISGPEIQPEPDAGSAQTDSAAAQDDEDLLIIPLRTAERRAEDFLPGWVRRFSRA